MLRTTALWMFAAAALLVCALVLGLRTEASSSPPAGATLGPESGEVVATYLRASAADLADASGGAPRWALLTPTEPLTTAAAAALAAGTRTSRVLLHVDVARVQTPLVAVELADQRGPTALDKELAGAQRRAGSILTLASVGETGRPSRVDAVAGARLRAGCACVVGVLLRGSPTALRAVAARPQARAVQPAPAGVSYGRLAVSPLLPQQTQTVSPGPDDGDVPAR
ncbi:MAG: hypothetical protein ABI181_05605 [Mycobacteriaceae bacterium]